MEFISRVSSVQLGIAVPCSDFESGDGLDGLSELEKLEPLPQPGHIGGDIPVSCSCRFDSRSFLSGFGRCFDVLYHMVFLILRS